MRKVTVILVILVILGGYLYISNPRSVVVSEKGRIKGLVNNGRALVQRDRFWHLQLKMAGDIVKSDTAPHLPSSSEMQALYHKMRNIEDTLNSKMKDLYTPEERSAEMYRIKADSIMRAGKWRQADQANESLRIKDAQKYKAIVSAIEARLNKIKK